jgi:bla regulator protein BlaR1
MMADPLGAWSLRLFDISWQAGLVAAAAWALCRLCPRMPAHVRAAMWWLVCTKFLVGLAWTQPIAVQWLPAGFTDAMAAGTDYVQAIAASWTADGGDAGGPTPSTIAATGGASAGHASSGARAAVGSGAGAAVGSAVVGSGSAAGSGSATGSGFAPGSGFAAGSGVASGSGLAMRSGATAGASAAATPRSRAWKAGDALLGGLSVFWICGMLLQLALMWRAWRRTRTLVEISTPADATVAALAATLSQRVGVSRVAVRLSASIETPRVTGALTSTILLPAAAQPLSHADLEMTLCHELLHVRRGDLVLGWLPSIAQALFFFHPCAWMATREYALAREAACDAAVLRILDAEPDAYGALLLRLGITHGDIAPVAVGASSSFRTLKRRLIMLQHTSDPARARAARWWIVAAAAALAIVPLRLVAQTQTEAQTQTHKQTQTVTSVGRGTSRAPGRSQSMSESEMKRADKAGTHDSWVLLHADDNNVTMSGRMEDVAEAQRQRGPAGGPLLWFRHAAKAYVIRDAATLEQVEALFAPIRKLGEQQGALGGEQGQFGTRQGEIGNQQGLLGNEMAELSAKLNLLNADQLEIAAKQLRNGNVEGTELKRQQAEIEIQMRKISEQIAALGRRQEELGRQQEALGREQEKFGQHQQALGLLQEAASKRVEQQLRELLERAIASGRAEPAR